MSRAAARRSKPQASERPALHLVPENEPAVIWAEYPRVEPGDYPAYCKWAKWYWDPASIGGAAFFVSTFLKMVKMVRLEPFQCGSTAVPGKGPPLAGAHSTYRHG